MDTIELAQAMNRRHFLARSRLGFGALAVGSLMGGQPARSSAAADSAHVFGPHFAPKAKRVIYLFQSGAPSQFETFDYKPKLQDLRGQELPASVRMGQRLTTMTSGQSSFPLAPSIFPFSAARPIRRLGFRSIAALGENRRRPVHRPLDVYRSDQPRSGRHVLPNRLAARRPTQRRRVGRLWPGQPESGFAVVRGDGLSRHDAQGGSAALRPTLGQRLFADALPGRETSQRQGSCALPREPGGLRSATAPRNARRHRGTESNRVSTRSATRRFKRASRNMSWHSACNRPCPS